MWFVVLLSLLASASAISPLPDTRTWHRVSHDTFFIGERDHPFASGEVVRGYAFTHAEHSDAVRAAQRRLSGANAVHFASAFRNHSSHAQVALHSAVRAQSSRCSAPIVRGARWRTSRGVRLYTKNRFGLSAEFIGSSVVHVLAVWQCIVSASRRIISIGPLLSTHPDRSARDMDVSAPNGINEIGFGPLAQSSGVIALTTLWLAPNEIVEFDMVLNDAVYEFGDATKRRSVIDLVSTMMHEAGHAHGLDDVSADACPDATMAATSSPGEILKRTPESDDIAGVWSVYKAM